MRKLIIITIITAFSGISLMAQPVQMLAQAQPVNEAATQTEARQKELAEWEAKLKAWQQNQKAAEQKSGTAKTTLPQTGPAEVTAIVAVASMAGGVAHHALTRRRAA